MPARTGCFLHPWEVGRIPCEGLGMERAHPAAVKNYTQLFYIRARTAANCSPIKYTLYSYLRSNSHEKSGWLNHVHFPKWFRLRECGSVTEYHAHKIIRCGGLVVKLFLFVQFGFWERSDRRSEREVGSCNRLWGRLEGKDNSLGRTEGPVCLMLCQACIK